MQVKDLSLQLELKKCWIITPREKGPEINLVIRLKEGPRRSKGNMNIKREIGDKVHLHFTIFAPCWFKHFGCRVTLNTKKEI